MSSRLRNLNSTKISFFAFQDIITSVSGILILVTLILATELDQASTRVPVDADPDLERKLFETLREQTEIDTENQRLQTLLAAAETAPASEKLEADIAQLRAQLAVEKRNHDTGSEQLAANQAAISARDGTLGLTGLKDQIQRVIQEAEALRREEAKSRADMNRLDQRIAAVQARLLRLRARAGNLWLIPDKSNTTKEPTLATVSKSGAQVQRFDRPDQTREFSMAVARNEFEKYLKGLKPTDNYVVFLVKPSGIELFERLVKLARDKGFEVGFEPLEEGMQTHFATPPSDEVPAPKPGAALPSPPNAAAPAPTNFTPTTTRTVTNSEPVTPPATKPTPPKAGFWQRLLEFIGLA